MKNKYLETIENYLPTLLPERGCREESVIRSMEYSLMAGGKRLRPTLVLSFCEALGGNVQTALPYACAVEMIHTYSLIHDDLPCMDNDDLRRGKPSNHKAFGESTALLAGDALQALAFDVMLSEGALQKAGANGAKAASILAKAIGASGMVGGQIIDLETEGRDPDLETIKDMYAKKTGALITASCLMGSVLACGREEEAARIYGEKTGLAFQIVDDILDIESDPETLGKPIGSDAENEKVNYVTKTGVEQGRALVRKLTEEALAALEKLDGDTAFLKELAVELSHRIN